ncbi:MAG TPA: amidohydrolase [Candidatus Didemnitutus sp.]|nr:amidohydrolase [Candidatus Didemnitutus sp.]
MKRCCAFLIPLALLTAMSAADDVRALVAQKIDADYGSLRAFYVDLHEHPELSLMETRTSAKVADELRAAGFEVSTNVGGHGVVAVLRNGPGPTVLFRSDMDALPVAEETGLPYASHVVTKDMTGREVAVMHACGHDIHMTSLVGSARVLASLKDHWSGTVVLIGQPAEERGLGAKAMLDDGLFTRFPRPDFALALHDSATLPAGVIGMVEGNIMANVDWVDITVKGVGGHGAYPHATKDPIVLSARIILALQTIVSRETPATEPCVVTVGSIHGGAKANVIPDEVKLQLTLRSYSDSVRAHTIEAIQRICLGEAMAAGMPEDRMPVVTVIDGEATPATYNTPELTRRLRVAITAWVGPDHVVTTQAEMAGEDFSRFGRTPEKIPLCLFRVGAADPAKVAESARTGVPLPPLHSSHFAPVPEPTIKAAINATVAAVLNLLPKS